MTENKETFNLVQFKQALETYGADLKRFPREKQGAAIELIKHSEPAQQLLAEAKALDAILDEKSVLPAFNLEKCQEAIAAGISADHNRTGPQTSETISKLVSTPIRETATIIDLQERRISQAYDAKETGQKAHQKIAAPGNDNMTPRIITGGLLAASLVLGLMMGSTGMTTIFETNSTVTLASTDLSDDLFYLSTNISIDDDLVDY